MKFISEADFSEILSDIQDLVVKQNQGALKNILIELHPADVADIVTAFRKEDRRYLFDLLPNETASSVLTELDAPIVEQILSEISDRKISTLVDQMDSDDAADIISDLPDEMADRILEQVPEQVSEEVKELLTYEEDTAGGIMALEFVAVNQNSTVKQTIKEIRRARAERGQIHKVWVYDDKRILTGSVALTDLVLAKGKELISRIMNTELKSVITEMDREEVAMRQPKHRKELCQAENV